MMPQKKPSSKNKNTFNKPSRKKSKSKRATPQSIKDGFNNPFVHKPDKIVDKKTGRTILIDAVLKQDIEKINLLIRSRADMNLSGKDKYTPLHHAARLGNVPIMKMLVEAGAFINAQERQGETPLFDALGSPDPQAAVAFLLKQGANADITNKDKQMPLHLAARDKSPELIKMLFLATEHPDQADEKGLTPLLHAAENNSIKAVQTLIFERVSLFSADKNSENVLHYAAKRKNMALLKRLLKTDAIRLINAVDLDGKTPIFSVLYPDKAAIVKSMIDAGANINVADKDKNTPLVHATLTNDIPFVKKIISWGGEVAKAKEKKCDTPLVVCIRSFGNLEMVKMLLDQQADPNVAEEDGKTPLMYAVQKGHTEIVKLLLASGADVTVEDDNERNLLHYVDPNIPLSLVDVLIQGGADINKAAGYGKKTPAMQAIQDGFDDLVLHLASKDGFDFDARDNVGMTVLISSIQRGKENLLKGLLAAGASVNAPRIPSGVTPLQQAVLQRSVKFFDILLKAKADIHAKDERGNTPLHHAIAPDYYTQESYTMVKKLLAAGADPLQENDKGFTPYDLAHTYGKKDILKLFEDYTRKNGKNYTPKRTPYNPFYGGYR